MERYYKVYKHTTPDNRVYIGQTMRSLPQRWSNGKRYKENKFFYDAILKYGWDNIKHEVLYETYLKEEAKKKENEFIKKHNATDRQYGYNIQGGARFYNCLEKDFVKPSQIKDITGQKI